MYIDNQLSMSEKKWWSIFRHTPTQTKPCKCFLLVSRLCEQEQRSPTIYWLVTRSPCVLQRIALYLDKYRRSSRHRSCPGLRSSAGGYHVHLCDLRWAEIYINSLLWWSCSCTTIESWSISFDSMDKFCFDPELPHLYVGYDRLAKASLHADHPLYHSHRKNNSWSVLLGRSMSRKNVYYDRCCMHAYMQINSTISCF